jgi:glucan biosynthesis protein C
MTEVLERRHYIDWVRVLAFFLLIGFHSAMPFVNYPWEVKNAETSIPLTRLIWWLHQWRLPLLFFISGVGIHFSLRRRTVLAFAGERFVRLFIPLLFAMFFTIPLQVYFEKLQKGLIDSGYGKFYPSVWNMVPYPEGSLTWSHMWFVVYLFVFCMLLLPVFAIFKWKVMAGVKTGIATFFSQPVELVSLAIPLVALFLTLFLPWPEQGSLLGDWFLFLKSLLLLFYGYMLGGSDCFWRNCEKYRFHFIGVAGVCIVLLYHGYWWNMEMPKVKDQGLFKYGFLNGLHIWMLILAILGFAKRHLNFSNRFLRYANEAVYPFYILHQTIIVSFGYYVVQWPLPIWIKLLTLLLLTVISLVLIYALVIRPFKITRILYGMKLKPRQDDASTSK